MSIFKTLLARTSLFQGMRQAQGTRLIVAVADPVGPPLRKGRRPDADLTALEREDMVLIDKIRRSLYADA